MFRPESSSTSPERLPGSAARRAPPAWRRAPFLLLLASFSLAAVGAWEAHRAIAGHKETVDGVLRDYAGFAAWTYGRHAEEAFPALANSTFRTVQLAMNSGRPHPHPDALLASEDPAAACECLPSLAGGFALRIPVADSDRPLEVAGKGLDPLRHGELVDEIRDAALAAADSNRMRGIVPVELDGARRLVAVLTVRCPEDGSVEAVYAVDLDRERLESLFREIHGKEHLLPPTLAGDQGNDSLLRLAVTEPGGGILFGEDPLGSDVGLVRTSLGVHFGDLEVAAAVLPEAADGLVIGGLPRSRAPFMLGIFGLAILLGVVAAGQLRRENELALLRSDFVTGVSHELRTPLAQIRLFLETLRMGRFRTAEEREWSLATIDRETRRLAHLVENVLHFSRGENGTARLEGERIALSAELRDLEEAFRPLARARKVEVQVDAAVGVWASAHRDSFRQAILNLLDNAVKYGPREGQVVRVGVELHGERVRLAVEDQGPGVPPEDRDRIWAPFQRGSQAGGRETGSGIGLSVVREILARSGGAAWVEDAPGGGARFVIELPGGRTSTRAQGIGGGRAGTDPLSTEMPETAPTERVG